MAWKVWGQDSDTAGHIRSQGEKERNAVFGWLPPFYFSQPGGQCHPHSRRTASSSGKPFWKHLPRSTQRCFHGGLKCPSPAFPLLFQGYKMKPKERFPLKNHVVFKELSRPFSLTPRHQIFCGLSPPECPAVSSGTTHAFFRSHGICACWSPTPPAPPESQPRCWLITSLSLS